MSKSEAGLAAVKKRIAAAETRAGRASGSVTLIAVSKTVPTETVLLAAQPYRPHMRLWISAKTTFKKR